MVDNLTVCVNDVVTLEMLCKCSFCVKSKDFEPNY